MVPYAGLPIVQYLRSLCIPSYETQQKSWVFLSILNGVQFNHFMFVNQPTDNQQEKEQTQHPLTTPISCSLSLFALHVRSQKGNLRSRWNESDKDSFRQRAAEGKIDITNITPAYIEKIRVKHWSGCSKLAFRTNYRAIASTLRTENDVAGQRSACKYNSASLV